MISIIYGLLIGAFVSLIGGGGASLYLGVLTSQLNVPTAIAVPTSLFVALPALFFGFLTQARIRNVQFRLGNYLILAALPGIVGGTVVARFISTRVYDWTVGVVLVVMGGVVLLKYWRPTSKSASKRPGWAIVFGLLSGLMVGIGGLSGGATTAAGLSILGLSAIEAAGTATYVLFWMSLVGFISHLLTSPIDWQVGLGLMGGAVVGAIITPLILQRLNYVKVNRLLTPLLGMIIIYFGVKLLV
ncbi:sulfite exporter TauE/SafE family protein [Levilactobacillus enshiensis]|uniref:sulfite exporter TauE/SafE family protein n=1 Tax=Levilactobacillus enshiensis TaxID=2590213 RepID=UPI00117997AC|nr:sulfite exporter TauE/SafE family protein [Levilactobacillus enshiensis]